MSLFNEVGLQMSQVPGKQPAPETEGHAASLSRASNHPELAPAEAVNSTRDALTGKSLTRTARGRKANPTRDPGERPGRRERDELMLFLRRVLASALSTQEKIRFILEVEAEYFRTELSRRTSFIRDMVALLEELEAGLRPEERNEADDRAAVLEGIRRGNAPVVEEPGAPEAAPPQPPRPGRIDVVA